MENWVNPYIDRLVGISSEKKELEGEWQEKIIERIETIGGRKIKDFEVEKNQEEIELINFAGQWADTFLSRYNRTIHTYIPPQNIHILYEGGTKNYVKSASLGACSPVLQSIIVDRMESKVQFSLVLFHELMHLKSFTALQVLSGQEKTLKKYRSGLSVISRDGKTEYFGNIQEAVIAYLTQRFYDEAIKLDDRFKRETAKIESGEVTIDLGREGELNAFYYFIDEIVKKNSNTFSKREEVLELFVKAQANGTLLKVARLIEHTFGEGTIREIDVE